MAVTFDIGLCFIPRSVSWGGYLGISPEPLFLRLKYHDQLGCRAYLVPILAGPTGR